MSINDQQISNGQIDVGNDRARQDSGGCMANPFVNTFCRFQSRPHDLFSQIIFRKLIHSLEARATISNRKQTKPEFCR
jgi:hypothetical protein